MTRFAFAIIAVWLLAGCFLDAPKYEETSFTCAEPPYTCPVGYDCISGVCALPNNEAPGDAGVVDDPTPDAMPGPPDARPPADAAPAPITTVTLSGTDVVFDTYLYANSPNNNYGNDDDLAIDADPIKIGLQRFALTAIPQNVEIVAAEIIVYVNDPIEDGDFVAYQLLEQWQENEATYIFRRNGVPWSAPGAGSGSYAPTAIATFAPRNVGQYVVPLPLALVQQWVGTPQTNYGIKWISNSAQGRGGQFDTAESGPTGTPPSIRIQYR